jgi:hypothetical protein
MTRVCDVPEFVEEVLDGLLDEQAAAPVARATAALMVTSLLGPSNLLVLIFVSCR